MDLPQGKTRTVLSIDWDFFFYRGYEAEDTSRTFLFDGRQMPLWGLFDWGHGESQGIQLQQMIWITRFQQFKRVGLNPYGVAGNNTELGCTDINAFREFITKHLAVDDEVIVTISDSHRHAYYTLEDAFDANGDEPVHVIHFDAHHDLGYGEAFMRNQDDGVYDCSDWLYAALEAGLAESVQVVYPNWRGLVEKEKSNLIHLSDLDVSFTTWDAWCKNPPSNTDVRELHIARSGAWVPPWFDDKFKQFVNSWNTPYILCMDCLKNPPEHKLPHACETRPWEDPPHDDAFQLFLRELSKPRQGL